MQRFCAYQERCIQEAREKLDRLKVAPDVQEKVLRQLQEAHFIDEQRFAQVFARSKFNQNQWGRLKIRQALEEREIAAPFIEKALAEIDQEAYAETLCHLLLKKARARSATTNLYVKRDKIARYLTQKGFEPDLIWQTLKALPEKDLR